MKINKSCDGVNVQNVIFHAAYVECCFYLTLTQDVMCMGLARLSLLSITHNPSASRSTTVAVQIHCRAMTFTLRSYRIICKLDRFSVDFISVFIVDISSTCTVHPESSVPNQSRKINNATQPISPVYDTPSPQEWPGISITTLSDLICPLFKTLQSHALRKHSSAFDERDLRWLDFSQVQIF